MDPSLFLSYSSFLLLQKGLWLPPASDSLHSRPSPASPAPPDNRTLQTTVRTELGRGIGGIDGLSSSGPTASTGQKTREIDSFLEGNMDLYHHRDFVHS